jgi:hypothetical protein
MSGVLYFGICLNSRLLNEVKRDEKNPCRPPVGPDRVKAPVVESLRNSERTFSKVGQRSSTCALGI